VIEIRARNLQRKYVVEIRQADSDSKMATTDPCDLPGETYAFTDVSRVKGFDAVCLIGDRPSGASNGALGRDGCEDAPATKHELTVKRIDHDGLFWQFKAFVVKWRQGESGGETPSIVTKTSDPSIRFSRLIRERSP
jgi:hypothetical protein